MNIYVGNLSFATNEGDLRELFSEFGEVESCSVIADRETGRSRGFGFVVIPDEGQAQAAIDALNGKDVGGRPLTINQARERSSGGSGDRGGRW